MTRHGPTLPESAPCRRFDDRRLLPRPRFALLHFVRRGRAERNTRRDATLPGSACWTLYDQGLLPQPRFVLLHAVYVVDHASFPPFVKTSFYGPGLLMAALTA